MSGAGEYLRKLLCFANSSYCLAMEPKKLVCCRKRLRYLVNKDGPSTTKGNAELDINDSNTWFKDLDSPLGKELLSFSPVEEKPKKNKSEGKPSPFPLKNGTETPGHDVGPRAEKMQPESREEHSHQYNEVESLFQEDCPIKTSSPIELGPEHRVTAVSRLLFNSDDGNDDEDQNHNKRPVSTQEQKFNDQEADMYNNVELDSAPWMYSLIKQETPTIISKEESPVRKLNLSLCSTDVESEGPNQSSPSLVVEPKEQPVPEQKTVVQPPPKKPGVQLPKKTTGFHPPKTMTEVQVPEKMSGVQPPGKTTQNHERKNFRQMLREAGFPKLAGKPLVFPVRKPPSINLEDEFQILEDDSPFRFSLCRKPNPNRTTSIPQLKPLDQSQSSDHTSAGTLAHASQSETATTRYRAKGEEIVRPSAAGHVGKKSKGQTVNRGSSNTPAHDKSSPKKWTSSTVQEAPPAGDAPVSNVDHKAELREQDKRTGRKKEKLSGPIGEEPVTTLEERKAVEEEHRGVEEKHRGVAEPCHQGAVDQEAPLSGNRRRRKPETWWLVDTDTQDTQTHNTHTTNKSNHNRDKPTTNPARQKAELKKRLSKSSSNQNTEKKAARWSRLQKMSREETERPESEEEEVLLSPMASPLRQHRHITTEKVFDWLYTRTPQSKLPQSDVTPRRQTHLAQDAQQKPARRSTAPGNCQKTSNSEDISRSSSASHPREPPHNPKTRKVERRKTKPAPSQTQPVNSSFIPWSGAAPPVATVRSTPQVSGQKPWSPEESPGSCGSAEEPVQNLASDRSPSPMDLSCQRVNIEPAVLVGGQLGTENPQNRDFYRRSNRLSDNTLRAFKSGPSSMIELEDYEDNEEDILMPYQSTQLKQAAVEELCGPPLKTITLQAEDSANLKEWLSLLWPVSGKLGSQISPDDFQWFAYRGRALGCRMDLQAGTFCSGKLLLGSYLKKPLIVDHNATTVYNLLTSFVSVTINGQKTHYNPGQTFMVECGHAYSLHNLTQEPAALHFTRILVESSD